MPPKPIFVVFDAVVVMVDVVALIGAGPNVSPALNVVVGLLAPNSPPVGFDVDAGAGALELRPTPNVNPVAGIVDVGAGKPNADDAGAAVDAPNVVVPIVAPACPVGFAALAPNVRLPAGDAPNVALPAAGAPNWKPDISAMNFPS